MTTIVIDGIFFQINEWSGIAKYWFNLLADIDKHLDQNPQQNVRIFLLLRGKSNILRTTQYKRIHKLPISFFDYRSAFSDFAQLGSLCRELDASAFISSYYTLAYGVPNIGMAYDFIPEHLNTIHTHHSWIAKAVYMESVTCTLAISESTARDASLFYPHLESSLEDVFYPPTKATEFKPIDSSEARHFRKKFSLAFPYIAIIGNRANYKNIGLLATALARRPSNLQPLPLGVVMTSGEEPSQEELSLFSRHFSFGVHRHNLKSDELTCLLHEAEMLFYPSLLEGFGYPILEAMAQGCPVITTGSTSISEILRHAQPDEYRIISGYDSEEVLPAIISLAHGRQRVSTETISRLKKAFCCDHSDRFLSRIKDLIQTAQPPLDDYLPACLVLDGLPA